MKDNAHYQTDEKLEEMEKHLNDIYVQYAEEIKEKAEKYFKKFEKDDEKKKKDLENGKITEEQYKQWKQSAIMRGKRYKDMQENATLQLLNLNKTAASYINDQLPEIYATNYNAFVETADGDLKGYSFSLVDANTIKNLATTDKSLLPYKEIDEEKDKKWNTKKINSEVLQGILQGDSMDKIADRLKSVTNMNEKAAIRNARTCVTGAENKGRLDSYKQAEKDGIILQKKWMATKDNRTRHWHNELDGVAVDINEPFHNEFGDIMFPADPKADGANVYNCRCTMISKIIGFKKKVEEKKEEIKETIKQKFIPAKTIEEAEKHAKEKIFSGNLMSKTSYKGLELETANKINETIENLTEKFGVKMAGAEVVNPKTSKGLKALGGDANAPFATQSLVGRIFINKDIIKNQKTLSAYNKKGEEAFNIVIKNKDKLKDKNKKIADIYEKAGKQIVNNSIEGMITHEYGHYLIVSINPSKDILTEIEKNMENYIISGYSQHNKSEYLAECFVEYNLGDKSKLDPLVVELFDKVAKK